MESVYRFHRAILLDHSVIDADTERLARQRLAAAERPFGQRAQEREAIRLICEPFVSQRGSHSSAAVSVVFIPPWLMPLVAPRNLAPEGGAFTQSASQGSS